jgi:hypothetical protein
VSRAAQAAAAAPIALPVPVALLGRAAILAADDLPTKDVAVPEWGGTVRVRTMTARDRDAIEMSITTLRAAEDALNVRAHYAAACLIDDTGEPLFQVAEVELLGAKSGTALDRVYEAVVALNKLAASDIEAAAKNS